MNTLSTRPGSLLYRTRKMLATSLTMTGQLSVVNQEEFKYNIDMGLFNYKKFYFTKYFLNKLFWEENIYLGSQQRS